MSKVKTKMTLTLVWREHSPQEVRVWREDWLHDVFEVWTKEEFKDFEAKATRFGIKLVEAED